MRSVMKHRFSEVPTVNIPRSTFDRSHGFKATLDASYLVPCFVDIAYPGDTFKINMAGFCRMAPSALTNPIMDNIKMDTFFFAVPIRLLWSNWKKFCGEQVNPGDSISYTIPQNVVNNAVNMSLADYMGIPTQIAANNSVNALPFRAYWMIYNEWFRDENLIDAVDANWTTGDGPDTQSVEATSDVLKRCKKHDYFTSCLPWLQKGTALDLPLGTTAPVYGVSLDFDGDDNQDNVINVYDAIGSGASLKKLENDTVDASTNVIGGASSSGDGYLAADLTQATAATVNELRQAIQLQRMLEKDARSGTRYIEIVKSYFGIESDDARMQRPEYLGGGSTPVTINSVAETASGTAGQLGAYGTAGFNGHGFVKSFTEHCIVIGLVNVNCDLTYQEGAERFWFDSTRYDLYWPTLAHLGEQAVLNREIYLDATDLGDSTDEGVFGYQERYAHLKYKPSRVAGKFRSNDAATLDAWHLCTEFGDTPTLDSTFIVDNAVTNIDRVLAAPTEPQFLLDAYFNFKATRPMPIYSVPGYVDHF